MKFGWIPYVLVGLLILAAGLVLGLADGTSSWSVIAGAVVPIAVSISSLVYFARFRVVVADQRSQQRFIIVNFLIKVVAIAVWMAVIFRATSLPRLPFIVSLLVNFLAWHLYEAYRYQQSWLAAGREREKEIAGTGMS
jgi:uncharacterized membrane-anchored protein